MHGVESSSLRLLLHNAKHIITQLLTAHTYLASTLTYTTALN